MKRRKRVGRRKVKNTILKYFRIDCNNTGNAYSAKKTGLYHSYVIWEFKNFTWKLEKLAVSDEDKINGVEWQGKIAIKATFFREYKMCDSDPSGNSLKYCGYWNKWEKVPEQGLFIMVVKKNGKWMDYEPNGAYWTFIPAGDTSVPDCSTIKNLKDDVEKRKKFWKE